MKPALTGLIVMMNDIQMSIINATSTVRYSDSALNRLADRLGYSRREHTYGLSDATTGQIKGLYRSAGEMAARLAELANTSPGCTSLQSSILTVADVRWSVSTWRLEGRGHEPG